MKVTALIADDLVAEVQRISGGKNITESITIALKHYLDSQKINKVFEEIESEPLVFREDFVPYGNRENNRNR